MCPIYTNEYDWLLGLWSIDSKLVGTNRGDCGRRRHCSCSTAECHFTQTALHNVYGTFTHSHDIHNTALGDPSCHWPEQPMALAVTQTETITKLIIICVYVLVFQWSMQQIYVQLRHIRLILYKYLFNKKKLPVKDKNMCLFNTI